MRRRRRYMREMRRFASVRAVALVFMFGLWLAFALVSASVVQRLLRLDVDAITKQPGLSPEVRAQLQQVVVILHALRGASTEIVFAVAVIAVVLFAFLVAMTDRLFFADKVSVLGFKFEISEALREAEAQADLAERTAHGLVENIQELQELDRQINALVRDPTDSRFFDVLDAVAHTAAFTIRPTSRAVRVSIWLYRKSVDTMRIIAAYRVSSGTRETFEMSIQPGSGFAGEVLREGRMLVKNENFSDSSGDWKVDRTDMHGTESILGAPIDVDHEDWDAVLCFSTDRREDAFSLDDDRAEAAYFATVASTLLTLALSSMSVSRTLMIEEFWTRYRRAVA